MITDFSTTCSAGVKRRNDGRNIMLSLQRVKISFYHFREWKYHCITSESGYTISSHQRVKISFLSLQKWKYHFITWKIIFIVQVPMKKRYFTVNYAILCINHKPCIDFIYTNVENYVLKMKVSIILLKTEYILDHLYIANW